MLIRCAFCKGTGVDPFFAGVGGKSNCQVCGGKKEVYVAKPLKPCSECNGTGRSTRYRLPCSACKGKGNVTDYGAVA